MVLNYIETLGQSEDLSLKSLSLKTVFLLAITHPSRSVDLMYSEHIKNIVPLKWGLIPTKFPSKTVTPREIHRVLLLSLLRYKQDSMSSQYPSCVLRTNSPSTPRGGKIIHIIH